MRRMKNVFVTAPLTICPKLLACAQAVREQNLPSPTVVSLPGNTCYNRIPQLPQNGRLRLKDKLMNTLKSLAATLLFAAVATAQVPGLCNTGETPRTASGCSGILVTPNPTGGGPNRDGNWLVADPYPSMLSTTLGACALKSFTKAWVDNPVAGAWIPNGIASEWITPYDGEGNLPSGWYVYATGFHVPALLTSGLTPKGIFISGRLASGNSTYVFALASTAKDGSCAVAKDLQLPVNPGTLPGDDSEKWTDFSFTSPIGITPGSDLFLYVVVQNAYSAASPTGLRVEFFGTSAFY